MIFYLSFKGKNVTVLGIYSQKKSQVILKQGEWHKKHNGIGHFRSGYSLELDDDIIEELVPFSFQLLIRRSRHWLTFTKLLWITSSTSGKVAIARLLKTN